MRTPSAGPRPALLDEHRKTDADHLAIVAARGSSRVEIRPVDVVQRDVEQRMVVAGVEMDFLAQRLERPLERHFVDRTGVQPAHLDRIELELCAMASTSRSRTKLVSKRPGAR